MTKLNWGIIGERFYEAGTDRGVLYINGFGGVPWNGLISVSESPTGGDPTPYYLDGFKYLNVAASEEFEATIEAFSSPSEFATCDGTVSIANGLFATQQPRSSFGFCYRTKLGNNVDGLEHGYKLHLVYNALAAPSSRQNSTITDTTEPIPFSWAITTLPLLVTNFKPASHFIIDSTKTDIITLGLLEDVLYGSVDASPSLPSPNELVILFNGV